MSTQNPSENKQPAINGYAADLYEIIKVAKGIKPIN